MELTPFLDRRLARRFQTFDYDGDGSVDRGDFVSAVLRLAAEFGYGVESPVVQRLVDLASSLWSHLSAMADTDENGVIDYSEYRRAFAAGLLLTEQTFDRGYGGFLAETFDVADTDGDGFLSEDDHARWAGSLLRLEDSVARAIHRRADSDGDGYVSSKALLDLIRAFYFDPDPEGPGSWVLGPLPDCVAH